MEQWRRTRDVEREAATPEYNDLRGRELLEHSADTYDICANELAAALAALQEGRGETPYQDYGVYSPETERDLSLNYTSNETRQKTPARPPRAARRRLLAETEQRAEAAEQARDTLPSFQRRVQPWLLACFGAEIAADRIERNHRFLEEALELVQTNGCTGDEAHQLVDYVYGRPAGEMRQEVGGVMVTLAALCLASGADMYDAAETELRRVWKKIEVIRAKQATKPKHSPLAALPAGDAPGTQGEGS